MTEITTDKLIQYSENLTDITQDQFTQFVQDAKALISTAQNPQDLQNIRVTLTGKKKSFDHLVKTAGRTRCRRQKDHRRYAASSTYPNQ